MTITMAWEYLARIVSPTEPDGAALIQDLREAVERANQVISEMLEFARPAWGGGCNAISKGGAAFIS